MASFFRFSGQFSKNLEKQAIAVARKQMIEIGEAQREVLKQKLLEAVRNHPISREISTASTPSKYISSKSGTASLRGYLGFEEGRDPIEELIEFLDQTIEINSRKKSFSVGNKIIVSLVLPKKSQMSKDLRLLLPWSYTAWPILLEDGISELSGASHFLQKQTRASVSGLGIQIKGVTRPDLPPTEFLSEIFSDFRSKFGNGN